MKLFKHISGIFFAVFMTAILSSCMNNNQTETPENLEGQPALDVAVNSDFDYSEYYTNLMDSMMDKLQFGYEVMSLNQNFDEAAWKDFITYMSAESEDYLITIARKDVPTVFKAAHEKLVETSEMYQDIILKLRKLEISDAEGRQDVFNEIQTCIELGGSETEFLSE